MAPINMCEMKGSILTTGPSLQVPLPLSTGYLGLKPEILALIKLEHWEHSASQILEH